MPTPTYTPLANITLGSSAASVTFSSISQAYRDLVLVVQATPVTNDVGLRFRINSDTGSNYNYVTMYGTGSTTGSITGTSAYATLGGGLASPNTIVTNALVDFEDYSVTDKHKSILARVDIPSGTYPGTTGEAYRWASTSALTTIQVYFGSGNIASGSTFALYGIAA